MAHPGSDPGRAEGRRLFLQARHRRADLEGRDIPGRGDAALQARFPGIRSFSFGHVGDGNIHYNPLQADGEPAAAWADKLPEVNRIVHDIVHRLGGSITAEHGIGRLRVGEVSRYKPHSSWR